MSHFLQSMRLCIRNMRAHAVRSWLSVMGISVGIFCMSTLYGLTDALEKKIWDSLSSFVKERSVTVTGLWWWTEWWGKHRQISYKEYLMLRQQLRYASKLALVKEDAHRREEPRLLKRKNNVASVRLIGITHGYNDFETFDMVEGDYFSQMAFDKGIPVAILGQRVAEILFPNTPQRVGRYLKLLDKSFLIVGVVREEVRTDDYDGVIYAPYKELALTPSSTVRVKLMVRGVDWDTDLELLEKEIGHRLRAYRKITGKRRDTFRMYTSARVQEWVDAAIYAVSIAGLVMGGCALLIGGLGTANIIFVSVREQQFSIGLQKALGAGRWTILTQFLTEAMVLTAAGGGLGMLCTWLLTFVEVNDFSVILTTQNACFVLSVSSLTGLLSGIIPAYRAALLTPIQTLQR